MTAQNKGFKSKSGFDVQFILSHLPSFLNDFHGPLLPLLLVGGLHSVSLLHRRDVLVGF